MKKCLSLVLLSIFFNISSAQQQNDSAAYLHKNKPQPHYLRKSRIQKAGAYILLASGLVTGAFGGLDYAMAGLGPVSSGPYLLAVSGAALIGSTFLFVKAAKNKKRAKALSFHLQTQDILTFSGKELKRHWRPAATIKLLF